MVTAAIRISKNGFSRDLSLSNQLQLMSTIYTPMGNAT